MWKKLNKVIWPLKGFKLCGQQLRAEVNRKNAEFYGDIFGLLDEMSYKRQFVSWIYCIFFYNLDKNHCAQHEGNFLIPSKFTSKKYLKDNHHPTKCDIWMMHFYMYAALNINVWIQVSEVMPYGNYWFDIDWRRRRLKNFQNLNFKSGKKSYFSNWKFSTKNTE